MFKVKCSRCQGHGKIYIVIKNLSTGTSTLKIRCDSCEGTGVRKHIQNDYNPYEYDCYNLK